MVFFILDPSLGLLVSKKLISGLPYSLISEKTCSVVQVNRQKTLGQTHVAVSHALMLYQMWAYYLTFLGLLPFPKGRMMLMMVIISQGDGQD